MNPHSACLRIMRSHGKLHAEAVLAAGLLLAVRVFGADISGLSGALRFEIEMPWNGRATVALCSTNGQLVRVLAQAVELPEGRHTVRWDGLDLWGRLVPAGTALECRWIASPGVRAFYEFAVAEGDQAPDHVPWLTQPAGTGLTMRTGGWLGDHTGPCAAAAIGERVFFGSRLVEHGHPLIACDLEGNKLWGGRLSGWDGPSQLFAMADAVLARVKNTVWRIDPETCQSERVLSTDPWPIVAMGTGPGKILLVAENPQSRMSPFGWACRHEDIRFDAALPQKIGDSAPEFQLSPVRQFSSVFCGQGGHFQTGFRPVEARGAGHVLVPFRQPRKVGTVVIGRIPGVGRVQVYALKAGKTYEPLNHDPVAALRDSEKDAVLPESEPGHDWICVGSASLRERVTVLPLEPVEQTTTSALYFRLLPSAGAAFPGSVPLTMCRLLERRISADPVGTGRVRIPDRATVAETQPAGGWSFRVSEPPSVERPADVLVDFGRAIPMDGVLLINNTSTRFTVEALQSGKSPEEASDADWLKAADYKAPEDKKYGCLTASRHDRTEFVAFQDTVVTRALRVRVAGGYRGGKVGLKRTADDPCLIETELLMPLRLLDPRPKIAPHQLRVYHMPDATIEREDAGDYGPVSHLAQDEDGTIYAIVSNTLARADLTGGRWKWQVLNRDDLQTPYNLQIWRNELVVGDASAVRFFDRTGRLLRTLGGRGHSRGSHDRNRLGPCSAVAIDRNGKVWIAEDTYAPKRISRFSMDGQCEKEFLGPPQYGGGGWLDPSLRNFFYRGMEFELDWERGQSRLKAFNDRAYTEETPSLEASTFGYTAVGRPIHLNGRRYIVGDPGAQFSPGVVIAIHEGDVWRPCAVIGRAQDSPFLMRKAVWKEHWQKQDLRDKLFIWCDRNDDGCCQIEEVELFARKDVPGDPTDGGYWGSRIGPDLTIWTPSARLAPGGFTPAGVPLYERRNIQAFDYARLAPFYTGLQRANTRAVATAGATPFVCADGCLSLGTQPFRVRPDLTLEGGPAAVEPSDYQPPVIGHLIDNPLHCAGTALTRSPVGEVAMIVGNGGVWSLISVKDAVLVDRIFTGEDGHWSTDLPARRGVEVTRRRHDEETFFGHFIRADNGKYYVVCGKGFHAICRLEGLDDLKVGRVPITVSLASYEANGKLREVLAAEARREEAAKRNRKPREITAPSATSFRLPPRVDGNVGEWTGWQAFDPPDKPGGDGPTAMFTAAHDAEGLYLAFRGRCPTSNQSDDPRYLFKAGFAIEFCYRTDAGNRSPDVIRGDRRVVLGRHRGEWVAVLYDYINPDAPSDRQMVFESPVLTTPVADVRVFRPPDVLIGWGEDIDVELSGEKQGGAGWVVEAFLPWRVLGFSDVPSKIPCDAGLMIPDSGGVGVQRRIAWGDPTPLPVSDAAWEARIHPGRWGIMTLR